MTWEEKLLFLMFLDFKGALKKWEKNHNEDKGGFSKIDDKFFVSHGGFHWSSSKEGSGFWQKIKDEWEQEKKPILIVPSLCYEIHHEAFNEAIEVGCQTITKEDALKIADFIYECFGESE